MGIVEAMHGLALYYSKREHLDSTYEKSNRLFLRAAEMGHGDSMVELGLCFRSGKGMKRDFVKASEWFQKAVDKSSHAGYVELGQSYEYGLGVEKDTTKAASLYEQAGTFSNVNLGRCLVEGIGITRDIQRGKEILENCFLCYFNYLLLGHYYAFGIGGFPIDLPKAYKCYVESGFHVFSLPKIGSYFLGYYYWKGLFGLKQDIKIALKWFVESAKSEYSIAQILMGYMFENGVIVPKNESIAKECYECADFELWFVDFAQHFHWIELIKIEERKKKQSSSSNQQLVAKDLYDHTLKLFNAMNTRFPTTYFSPPAWTEDLETVENTNNEHSQKENCAAG